jgi:hypothetical protein
MDLDFCRRHPSLDPGRRFGAHLPTMGHQGADGGSRQILEFGVHPGTER